MTEEARPSAPQRFTVEPADADGRLQQFLAKRLSLSLSQTNRLLDLGAVQVDHWIAKRKHKGYKLRAGQKVVVTGFDRPGDERPLANPALTIEILAEDVERGWVVANKPAGVPVHPLDASDSGTVLNALIARYPQIAGVGEGGLRSGVVHRLDLETSGALVFALKEETWQRLRDAFAEHRTRKIYRAIVLGDMSDKGEAKLPLHIAQHKPAKVRIVDASIDQAAWPPGTRLCDLSWRTIERLNGASLVEIELGTGFLHQIRAMLAHLGYPVAGDAHYLPSDMTDPTAAPRVMLHAAELRVEEVDVRCEVPTDFAATLLRLRAGSDPSRHA